MRERDRERGVPRFNEFRRQYGLRQLTSFDDFIDPRLAPGSPERADQVRLVGILREIYGQHRCDASKIITEAQVNADGTRINDCLGQPHGSLVDNVEDVAKVGQKIEVEIREIDARGKISLAVIEDEAESADDSSEDSAAE